MMSFHKASITREIDACHGYTSYGAADWRRTGSRRNLHAKLLHHLVVGHTLDPADERNQVLKERGFDVGIWNVALSSERKALNTVMACSGRMRTSNLSHRPLRAWQSTLRGCCRHLLEISRPRTPVLVQRTQKDDLSVWQRDQQLCAQAIQREEEVRIDGLAAPFCGLSTDLRRLTSRC